MKPTMVKIALFIFVFLASAKVCKAEPQSYIIDCGKLTHEQRVSVEIAKNLLTAGTGTVPDFGKIRCGEAFVLVGENFRVMYPLQKDNSASMDETLVIITQNHGLICEHRKRVFQVKGIRFQCFNDVDGHLHFARIR